MKPRNLISAYQGEESIDKIDTEEYNKLMTLKRHEICNLHSFCDVMIQEGCSIGDFDGFLSVILFRKLEKSLIYYVSARIF